MWTEWRSATFGRLLEYSVAQWPERVAVVSDDRTLTYRELSQEVDLVARALVRHGVKAGDHVGYLMSADIKWVELFFAALSLGARVVPLNLQWTDGELADGLRRTNVRHLIIDDEFRGIDLRQRVLAALGEDATIDANGDVSSSRCPSVRTLIRGSEFDGKGRRWSDFVEGNLPQLPGSLGPKAEDTALLLLTSGTSAFPKPAMHSHQSMLAGITSYADGLEASADDRFLHTTPNYHVGGIITMCIPLLRGGSTHLMGWFDAADALRRIPAEEITLLWGFDTHFTMMREQPSFSPEALNSVTRTMVAASPAAYDTIASMGFEHIGSLYGSTEYMGSQAFFPYRDRLDSTRMRETHGRPTSGEIRIIDPDSNLVCGPLEPGEICVRGPALFSGYYGMDEATAEAIDADGFFHSGDYGWVDSEGYLYYRGRYKDVIKTGGENVSAAEVELVLQQIPGVERAVVIGTPHKVWNEAVTALIQLETGVQLSADDIRVAARQSLAGYKAPKLIFFVTSNDLTITPTGKLDRQAAAELARDRCDNPAQPSSNQPSSKES